MSPSNCRFNIDRVGINQALRWEQWYHTAISWPTHRLLTVFVSAIVAIWLVLAGLLMAINHDCNLQLDSFGEAVFLAIITVSTIGCEALPLWLHTLVVHFHAVKFGVCGN